MAAVPGPFPGKGLAERNREAFRRHQPGVAAFLDRIARPASVLVRDAAGSNVDLGGSRLYPESAETWTASQIETFMAEPDRIGFADPANCNLSPVSRALLREIVGYFERHHPAPLSPYPLVDVGYTFVLGVGLGLCVPEFLSRDLARNLVLVEPIPEFLVHSLEVVDWEAIFREAEEKRISIRFLVGGTPPDLIAAILTLVEQEGRTFIEGSHAFLGYYSWDIKQVRALLNEKLQVLFTSAGFFEDELLMTGHTYLNLKRFPFHLIQRKPFLRQDVPVFIVGSGPSLDEAIPVIRKWRDRAIVFSCGTALGILLKNGIRPDLHNENENTSQLLRNLEEFSSTFGLEGIRLVCSTTVDPRVPALFDRRWFYFRPQLSSAHLLSNDVGAIAGPGPLVANAAYAAAATLGFRDIYLFGVDCGRRADSGHHAKDAVYYGEDYDNYLPGEGLELLETEFNRPVPGNFGGEALTTWYLDMSRASFTAAQRVYQANLVNCGNGARIDGAKPRSPQSLSFSGPAGAAAGALETAERQMESFSPGAFLAAIDMEPFRTAADRHAEAFRSTIEAALREDEGFWEVERRLDRFVRGEGKEILPVQAIIDGSFRSMIRLGAFGGTRIADPEARRRFLAFFLERYRDACLAMAREAGVMLAEMAEGKDRLSAIREGAEE
jgi:hypothetical protein